MSFLTPTHYGLGLLLLFLFVFAIFIGSLKYRFLAVTGVIVGLIIQGFHSFEHLVQVIYWGNYPLAPPFMSPPAKTASAGLEALAQNFNVLAIPTLGMELLHLFGNMIFLTGALTLLFGKGFSKSQKDKAKILVLFEGLHLLEHVLTTTFVLIGQTAWGASVIYGELSGSQAATYRIWWHFIMNLAGFLLFAWAALPTKARSRYFFVTGLSLIGASFVPLIPTYFVPRDAGYPGLDSSTILFISILICLTPTFIAGVYSVYEGYLREKSKIVKSKIVKSKIVKNDKTEYSKTNLQV